MRRSHSRGPSWSGKKPLGLKRATIAPCRIADIDDRSWQFSHLQEIVDRRASADALGPFFADPGFTVRTRKIVVRVSGATTGCGVTREGLAAAAVVIEPASGIAMRSFLIESQLSRSA
jgi:hypothetical protein